jgi:tRNA threonylcarbamoyladenosine biosynthesis protein TsaE
LGEALAPAAAGVLCLSGQHGAGKTTLVNGLAEGLRVALARDVTSPTFLRLVRFDAPGRPSLVHVDAYRMNGPDDVFELGLEEDLAGGAVVALEWPENVEAALPVDHLRLELDHVDDGARRVRLRSGGPQSLAWLERWVAARDRMVP